MYRKVQPHTGFQILLELVKAKNNNYFVFTSNVDGQASSISPLCLTADPFVCWLTNILHLKLQFQKAGFDENKIVECHGS